MRKSLYHITVTTATVQLRVTCILTLTVLTNDDKSSEVCLQLQVSQHRAVAKLKLAVAVHVGFLLHLVAHVLVHLHVA